MSPKFTIRVYGLLVKNGSLLVSDERIKDMHITKLPGGGLEFGESTIECVIREFKEELDLNVEVVRHFYTTDFFVPSAFDPSCQVMSIYYFVDTKEAIKGVMTTTPHDYSQSTNDHAFRWVSMNELQEDAFTFSIDKKVIRMLKELVQQVNTGK